MAPAPEDREGVRRQLERVLASSGFVRNERMRRFLRFLTEQKLDGHGAQLKESVIAVEVFGRGTDHDPSQDSIVRTEAGRLRARLAEYYVGEGKDDAVVIELPKGGYTPVFREREVASAAALVTEPPAKKRSRRVQLAVAVAAAALAVITLLWVQQSDRFWRSPLEGARYQSVTDFDGTEQDAAVSRDGKFVAFLSDRAGQTDVWVTQPGSGQFHNLTHGSQPGLFNPSIRTLGFSPDGSLVTFWARTVSAGGPKELIDVWAVPTLGGQPERYLEGAAEFDWSRDGAALAYHTPDSGDPLFVSDGTSKPHARPISIAPAGLHSHFPLWAPDGKSIYFVRGALPDKLDIWRIKAAGGQPEQITSLNARVSYPVFLNRRTLLYLAGDSASSGLWIYSMDVERRISHRLSYGPDGYTSLAATVDGKRLVVTRASSRTSLWRVPLEQSGGEESQPVRIALTPGTAFSPRLGPGYLIFVSSSGEHASIWKQAGATETELWSGQGAQSVGSPAISPDGARIAFSVRHEAQTSLYVMRADGTNAHVVTDSLELQGSPAWTPDGRRITTAANVGGVPRLFEVPVDGGSPAVFLHDYSVEPAWQPAGRYVLFSGPDIGTTFSVKAVTPEGAAYPLTHLTNLTRGARRVKFFPGGSGLVYLRGGIEHKDLWWMDPETGRERQLTNVPADFYIRDFDISPDGREVVLERGQARSDILLLDLAGAR